MCELDGMYDVNPNIEEITDFVPIATTERQFPLLKLRLFDPTVEK